MDDVKSKIVELDLNDILPNRFQPRIKFNEESIIELCDSIKEHGVIQPIIVRPIGDKYEIVAGERRYKACVLSGLSTIPARIISLNDKDSAEVALIENVQREGLTPIEEAISYKKILDMGYITQEQLARKLGKSQSAIANKKRLLNLCDEVQEALMEEKISERHARSLLKLTSEDDQKKLLKRIISERLTVRKLDLEIEKYLNGEVSLETTENNQDVDVDKIKNEAKDINIDNSIIDISSLFDEDILDENIVIENKVESNNLKTTELYKDKSSKEETGVETDMFIENNENNKENSNPMNPFAPINFGEKMSMNDILKTENESNESGEGTSGGTQSSMFNNLMEKKPEPDNFIDEQTFNNYLDPAYIDGQKQAEPENKEIIDSSVFSKFLDPEYDLSKNNNPVKDQLTKNEPSVSSMSFADYLNSDTKAEDVPVVEKKEKTSSMNMNDLLSPTILESVPEIETEELPIVVPSEVKYKFENDVVTEDMVAPVKEVETPIMVTATDLNTLSVPTPELTTAELLGTTPVEFDDSIVKNVSNAQVDDVFKSTETENTSVVSTLPTPVEIVEEVKPVSTESVSEVKVTPTENISEVAPVPTITIEESKPDLLAPIGAPVNSNLGSVDPNKTIEQVNREREEAEKRLYEQATAPLTPDFSLSKKEEPVKDDSKPVNLEATENPIFVTATPTSVTSRPTSPIINNPELSNLLKSEPEKEEVKPVVEEVPVIEPKPVETIINPAVDTIENRPIIVTDYNKQYDPVLPTVSVDKTPKIELKEVINRIRKLDSEIEALGFSIDTEEYDLEDCYQVIFKIDKK